MMMKILKRIRKKWKNFLYKLDSCKMYRKIKNERKKKLRKGILIYILTDCRILNSHDDDDDDIERKAIEEFKEREKEQKNENKNENKEKVNEEVIVKPIFKSSKKSNKTTTSNHSKVKTSIHVNKTLNNKQLLSFGDDDDDE